jgi:ubiquinone/menaquinone biosynthesis C-methylase UbiE
MSREEQRFVEYDVIGKTYNVTRQADARILQDLLNGLEVPVNSLILDVGAGTGNYSVELAKKGYKVIAVEPSYVMRETGKKHPNLMWLEGFAENLPLEEDSVDGIICTLAIHHFGDLSKAFKEMVRVSKSRGKIVVFAADPWLCPEDRCWLQDYFKPIISQSYQVYKPMEEVSHELRQATNNHVEVKEFPVPFDIMDYFFASAWRRPELYLEHDFRAGVSALAKCPDEILSPLLHRLETDLRTGKWDEKYGSVRSLDTYEGGYRFLITSKL